MLNLVDLTNKLIVITGASQGIGKDTAIMLSKLGARCVLVARNEEKLQKAMAELDGTGHAYYALDIADLDAVEVCIKNIVAENGRIDGLVYSAGILNDRPLNLFKPSYIEEIFRVNLFGYIEFVRCISKKNRYNPGMRIVGISSTAGICGSKAHLGYSASKAGIDGATRCMAVELAAKGIAANTVAPGMINTDMYRGFIDNIGEDSDYNKGLLERQFLGVGETSDVAAAIAFLISPASRFITGICLPVDGGFTCC